MQLGLSGKRLQNSGGIGIGGCGGQPVRTHSCAGDELAVLPGGNDCGFNAHAADIEFIPLSSAILRESTVAITMIIYG